VRFDTAQSCRILRLAGWRDNPVGSNFGAFLLVAENAIPSTHRNVRHARWGHLQRVENSEVLFGYFLFKEKVTDAPAFQRVASLLLELSVLPLDRESENYGNSPLVPVPESTVACSLLLVLNAEIAPARHAFWRGATQSLMPLPLRPRRLCVERYNISFRWWH